MDSVKIPHINNINELRQIRLTDNSIVTKDELIDRLNNNERLYSYFNIDNDIIVDKVTIDNIDLVGEFSFGISADIDGMIGYSMIYQEYPDSKGEWKFVHEIVDQYNIRHNIYGDSLDITYEDPSDYPSKIHHKDSNKLNNNPDNIVRVSSKYYQYIHGENNNTFTDEKFIPMDYYRKVARCSKYHEVREYGRLMFVANQMKSHYNEYITEKFYDDHKYEFSKRPARWSRLISEFKDVKGINEAINHYLGDNLTKKNPKRRIRIYLASGFFCDDDRSLVPYMEAFLEARGYDVYSPSRDGIVLSPNATQEERNNTFKENITEIKKSDLMIALVNNKDTGTSVEIGLSVGSWSVEKSMADQLYYDDPDIMNDHDKAIHNQECPRIITFSDNNKPLNVMILGSVMKHCMSWKELGEYLDYIDEIGIENARKDNESLMSTKVY